MFHFLSRLCGKGPGNWPEAEALLQSGNLRLVIIPIVNLKGRKAVEAGDECLRTTVEEEDSVDLNRNALWGWENGDRHQGSEVYRGRKPLSQFQTRIIQDLANETRPQVYVDLHSGARSLMVPFGHIADVGPDFPSQEP